MLVNGRRGSTEHTSCWCFSTSSDFAFGQSTTISTGQVCSSSALVRLTVFEFGRSEKEVEGVQLLWADGSRQSERTSLLLVSRLPSPSDYES